MHPSIELSQRLFEALLKASPDLTLLTKGDRILSLSPGSNTWLDAERLKQSTLSELLSKSQYTEFSKYRELAIRAPGQAFEFNLLIAPSKQVGWDSAGVHKPTYFDVRLVAAENQQLVCLLRDTTKLRALEKQRSNNVMRDPLTGLRSHRSLMPVLEKAIGDCQRFEESFFSLLVIDIDHFSDINDRYGWDAGDKVLRSLANMLEEQRRSSDYLCRFGDDLFAMVLTETHAEQAVGAGRRIQRLFSALVCDFPDQPLVLTLSAGVAPYDAFVETPHDLIQLAQENLMIAISSGGNEVVGPV